MKKFNDNKASNPVRKWAKYMSRYFSKDEIHRKISLTIRKKDIKNHNEVSFTLWLSPKKQTNKK